MIRENGELLQIIGETVSFYLTEFLWKTHCFLFIKAGCSFYFEHRFFRVQKIIRRFNISNKVRLTRVHCLRVSTNCCVSFRHALLKHFRFRAPRIISWFLIGYCVITILRLFIYRWLISRNNTQKICDLVQVARHYINIKFYLTWERMRFGGSLRGIIVFHLVYTKESDEKHNFSLLWSASCFSIINIIKIYN